MPRQSDWQGVRGRSAKRVNGESRKRAEPTFLKCPKRGTQAFKRKETRRNRKGAFGRNMEPHSEPPSPPGEARRDGTDRGRKASAGTGPEHQSCPGSRGRRKSGGWWQHRPPFAFGAGFIRGYRACGRLPVRARPSLDTASRQARRLLEMSGSQQGRPLPLPPSSRASVERSRDAPARDRRNSRSLSPELRSS